MMHYTLKKISGFLYISLFLLFISCGGVNADAKKAAKLTNSSIEKTNQLKLEEAEKDYKKAREIIEKYDKHDKSAKFLELYQKYRDENKLNENRKP